MKWINVKKKLPKSDVNCLVVMAGHVQEKWYRFQLNQWEYIGDYGIWTNTSIGISHWMPIPKPPNKLINN